MGRIVIENGSAITVDGLLKHSRVIIEGRRITYVGKTAPRGKSGLTINADGCIVSPGFIDIHIHGDPERIFAREIRHGTTSVVIAKSCDSIGGIEDEVAAVTDFIKNNPFGKNLLGLHLEGPFINKKRAGAQDKRYIRPPSKEYLRLIIRECAGLLKIMTIAPELKGAIALIRMLCGNSVLASIGHTDASFAEARSGIDSGARHATHIFNGMRGVDRREPGAAGAVLLDERVSAEIVLDLVHVHSAAFEILARVKDRNKIVLITDSIVSMRPDPANRAGKVFKNSDGSILGSSLTMIGAIKNAVVSCGHGIIEAVTYATRNPARVLGLEGRKGTLGAGADADIVIFDRDFDVKMTMIGGNIVYRAKGF